METVAVFSEADRNASYLHLADERICIGKAASAESYLNIPRIIAAAEIADVDAIHPGYGFLAENSHFAQVCRDCKIEFIGPSAQSMKSLGDKIRAKELAKAAKVPTTPDSNGGVDTVEHAVEAAAKIGYPVAIKAAAGGGGRESASPTTRPRCDRASSRPSPRRKSPSRMGGSTWKSASRISGTSRCRSWATRRATWCTSLSASAPSSGGGRR